MIGNWINDKVNKVKGEKASKEIDTFLLAIKAKSDQEVGMLMAVATLIRLNLAKDGGLPKAALTGTATPTSYRQALIFAANIIRQFQKHNQPFDAAGGMVWLHSLKVQSYPELSDQLNELWTELKRGFPHVEEKLKEIAKLTGKKTPKAAIESYCFLPAGITISIE